MNNVATYRTGKKYILILCTGRQSGLVFGTDNRLVANYYSTYANQIYRTGFTIEVVQICYLISAAHRRINGNCFGCVVGNAVNHIASYAVSERSRTCEVYCDVHGIARSAVANTCCACGYCCSWSGIHRNGVGGGACYPSMAVACMAGLCSAAN